MRVLDRGKSVSDRAHTRLNCCVLCPESQKGIPKTRPSLTPRTCRREAQAPDLTSGASSHQAHKHVKVVSEDPRTEPHVPAHAAPENPTPITLEDMSDQGGVGSVKAEATLTHPSARDSPAAQ